MLLLGMACFLVAAATSWAATPLVIRLAAALGAVDQPDTRKVHAHPIPRLGGLAVFGGFILGMTFAAFATENLSVPEQVTVYWRGLAFAATSMLLVGAWDDLRGLAFQWKFAAQIAASVYVWSCGFRIEAVSTPFGGVIDLGIWSLPLTILWVVGITNAVNLIDGLDGLAAGIALITTSTVASIAFLSGKLGITAASVALAGALAGFLIFNFNPARIFLGDSGSMFLGFVLAVTSVRGSQKGPTAVAVFVPLLVLGLPLLDTTWAVVRRFYRLSLAGVESGRPVRYVSRNLTDVFRADRRHIHHRPLEMGLSHRRSVMVLYGVGVLFALSAFALVWFKSIYVGLMLLLVVVGLMAIFLTVLYLRSPQAAGGGETRVPKAVASPPRAQSR